MQTTGRNLLLSALAALSLSAAQADCNFTDFRKHSSYRLQTPYVVVVDNKYHCFPMPNNEEPPLNMLWLTVDADNNIVTDPDITEKAAYTSRLLYYVRYNDLVNKLHETADGYKDIYNTTQAGELALDMTRFMTEVEASLLFPSPSGKVNIVAEGRNIGEEVLKKTVKAAVKKAAATSIQKGLAPSAASERVDKSFRLEMYGILNQYAEVLDSVAGALVDIDEQNEISYEDAEKLQERIMDGMSYGYGAIHALKYHFDNICIFLSNQAIGPIAGGLLGNDLDDLLSRYDECLDVFSDRSSWRRTTLSGDFGPDFIDDKRERMEEIVDDVCK